MIPAEDPLAGRQGLLVERQGLVGAAQLDKTVRQVVEAHEGAGMIWAEDPFAALQGLPV